MKLCFQLFVFLSSVSTVLITAEPCAPGDGNFGQYNMVACNFCAEHGKGHGQCCDAIYRNSLGRNDDDSFEDQNPDGLCLDIDAKCEVGEGSCIPGLTCAGNNVKNEFTGTLYDNCRLDKNADEYASASLVTSSSLTGTSTTTMSVSSFVLVAGAAVMIAMKVVRHRILLHRHQYSEVEAAATHIDV